MNYSRINRNSLVELSLDLRLRSAQACYYLQWFLIDVVIVSVFVMDMWRACPCYYRTYSFQAERAFTVWVGLCALACFVKYLWLWSGCNQVVGTEAQKRLLDGHNDNSTGTIFSRPVIQPDTDAKDGGPFINWHSSFVHSGWGTQSLRLRPNNQSSETTYRFPFRSRYVVPEDFLTDPRQLPALIKKAEREREFSTLDNAEALSGSSNTNNMTYMLRTTTYQLSPPPEVYTENAPTNSFEEFGGSPFKESNSEVINSISLDTRSRYVANLRHWISSTILKRLVTEINYADEVFAQCGLDLKFGEVSAERIRQYAENVQFVQTYAPHLPMVLAFLDSFSNQEYVVQRIKELSEGSLIPDFRWNSGSALNGQEWADHLPTDTAILFNLICVYLDSQLMPLPQNAGRPFYSRYVLIHDGKHTKDIVSAVHNKADCAILTTSNQLNPKLNFISGGELHNCVYNRNNLFYVIIEFLIYMRQYEDSALEGLNLGKIGLNIMHVIEDEGNPTFMPACTGSSFDA